MGEKIRLKDLEGDSEEITKVFNNAGCSLSDYLNISKRVDIKDGHYFCAILGFVLVSILTWTAPLEYLVVRKVLWIMQLAVMAVTVALTHMKFKAKTITGIALFFCAIIMLVTMDVLSPQDAGQTLYKHGEEMVDKHLK